MRPRTTKKGPVISDYFGELYVAGRLADAGWNVYFPHRDEGFDFIATKAIGDDLVIRPVQVKGKYPTQSKTDKPTYGYVGKLSQTHPDMVLAIPYFDGEDGDANCLFVAYMPLALIRPHSRGFRCEPAGFKCGRPEPRRDYRGFFDSAGILLMERDDWSDLTLADAEPP